MDVAAFRKSRGWTQLQLAERLGLRSKAYVCQLEKGRVPFTIKIALKLQQLSNGQLQASKLVSPAEAALLPPEASTPPPPEATA